MSCKLLAIRFKAYISWQCNIYKWTELSCDCNGDFYVDAFDGLWRESCQNWESL